MINDKENPDNLEKDNNVKVPILISVLNQKGGVGKTTSLYNMAYLLAEKAGFRVLMIDADAQCNLTQLILGEENSAELYREDLEKQDDGELITLLDCFRPIIEETGVAVMDRVNRVKLSNVLHYKKLFLLPGHLSASELDNPVSLGFAKIGLYKRVPGIITNFFRKIAIKENFDFVFIDLSPSIVGLNQAILLGSDYFCIPYVPDVYCVQSLKSLTRKIDYWKQSEYLKEIQNLPENDDGYMKFSPSFLGAFGQKIKVHKVANQDKIVIDASMSHWIKKILEEIDNLIKVLKKHNMLSGESFKNKKLFIKDYCSIGLNMQALRMPVADCNILANKGTPQKKVGGDYNKQKEISIMYFKLVSSMLSNLKKEHLTPAIILSLEKMLIYMHSKYNFELNFKVRKRSLDSQKNYWYDCNNINTLLHHYLSVYPDLEIFFPISGTSNRGKTLQDNIEQFIHTQSQRNEHSGKNKVIIPINLNDSHWVLVYLKFENDNTTFYYFDPLGNNIDNDLKQIIIKSLKNPEFIQLEERLQNDSYNCGPWVVEAACNLIEKNSLPYSKLDIDIVRHERHKKILSPSPVLFSKESSGSKDKEKYKNNHKKIKVDSKSSTQLKFNTT